MKGGLTEPQANKLLTEMTALGDTRRKLLMLSADLLQTIATCYRFPGSARANIAAKETLQQYGVVDSKGAFVKENEDAYIVAERYAIGDEK